MTPTDDYGRLLRSDRPVVTSSEAAAIWETSVRTAGRRLRAMERGGLVRGLRRGLWALFPELSLPKDLNHAELGKWVKRIESPRLRTLVSRRLGEIVDELRELRVSP